jgi:molecular chaperone DnaK
VKKQALIIANSRYSDEHFTDLPAAAADAVQLQEVLADPAIGGFQVSTLVDASQRQAMRTLEGFFDDAGPDDLLLLHLSVHGWKDLYNRLYFIMSDTERGYPGATAIAADTVSDWMSRSRSKRIVVTLDCCYSGAFIVGGVRRSSKVPEVDVAEPLSGNGRAVLTASTSLQYSHEDEQEVRYSWLGSRPSVFTRAMVDGLRDGTADKDQDGHVSVHDLYSHIDERVRAEVSGQTPTLSVDNIQGVIYLARNPVHTAADDGFDRMREASDDTRAWMRVGSLFEIERQLGSVHLNKREAAKEALLKLIADRDPEVARRARDLWHERGLGEVPDLRRPRSYAAPHPGLAGTFAVGIDFGTTNSSIAYFDGEDVQVIPNREGYRSTPSLVAIAEDGALLVGNDAKRQMIANPDYTVRSVKLKLGTDWSIERVGVRLTAERAAELILAELRRDAEAHLGREVVNAIVTVPSNFSRVQRLALLEASSNAGLNVYRLLNEPTAAALTLGPRTIDDADLSLLIFDMGGGTLDVTVAELGDGVVQVKSSRGDNRLGGDDWDRWLMDHFVEQIRLTFGVEINRTAEVEQRLWTAAEQAKVELSSARSSRVLLPYLAESPAGPFHFDYQITRDVFENGTRHLLERCAEPIRKAHTEAHFDVGEEIDEVILTGGATRMPAVEGMVREASGCDRVYRGLIPEGIVAGATLEAAMLTGAYKGGLLLDVVPDSISVRLDDGRYKIMFERDTTIPTSRAEVFTTAAPDQAAATILFTESAAADGAEPPRGLAVLELKGLSPAPQGEQVIEVTIDVDPNNLVLLKAHEVGTENEVSAVVDRRTIEEAEHRMRLHGWPEPGTGIIIHNDQTEQR